MLKNQHQNTKSTSTPQIHPEFIILKQQLPNQNKQTNKIK